MFSHKHGTTLARTLVMDNKASNDKATYLHPAYLFVGPQGKLERYAEQFIRQHLCVKQKTAACTCINCKKIQQRQHHALVWISPSKDYTVDDIEIIFDTIKFSLDHGQKFFFVLNHAQTLNLATANRLLKVLEEPADGYHFMLLATNEQALLPTIVSRCLIQHIQEAHDQQDHQIITYLTDERKLHDPLGFEQVLQKYKPTDTESKELLETILNHYMNALHNHFLKKQTLSDAQVDYYNHVIAFLQEYAQKPPQSGSSGIFWKTVYLLFPKQ